MRGGGALISRETGLTTQVRHEKLTNGTNGHRRGWWPRAGGGQESERQEGKGERPVARSQKADADVAGRRTCVCGGRFFSSLRARRPAMSKKLSRDDALDDISAWDTEGVLCLLRKVSEASRDSHVAVGLRRASLRTVRSGANEGNRVAVANRCNFTADADCQRRDTEQRQGALHGDERDARRTCASKAANTRVFIARLIQLVERSAAEEARVGTPGFPDDFPAIELGCRPLPVSFLVRGSFALPRLFTCLQKRIILQRK